jgi:hypothetical protein
VNKDTILERQTDFSREELVAFIKDGGGGRPPCLYVNELVVLFWRGDTEAGKVLCDLLQDSQISIDERYPVYAGLSSVPNPGKEIRQVLEDFRSKSENQMIMKIAEPAIQETKKILVQIRS